MVDLSFSKQKLRAIIKKTLIVIVILALASLFYTSKPVVYGVILGGGVSVFNLFILGKLVEAILLSTRGKAIYVDQQIPQEKLSSV